MPKPMNLENFLIKAKEIHGDFYDYSKVIFNKMSDIITIVCKKHGEFEQRVSVHINDKCGCKICGKEKQRGGKAKTIEQFIEDARKIHGDKYDYPSEYVNAHTDLVIHCRKCDKDFLQRPDAHLFQKQGCPDCGLKKQTLARSKTTEEFIAEAKLMDFNQNNDYSETIYINKETKIKFCCKEHGIIEQYPPLHIKTGCQFCNGQRISKYNNETFIKRAREVHGNTYEYPNLDIETIDSKISILCTICKKTFDQRASNHINGNGCPHCKGGVAINNEEFIRRAKEQHPDKLIYDETEYIGSHEKIKVICEKHGKFEQVAYTHLNSAHACPYCVAELTSSKAEKEIVTFIKEYYSGEVLTNDRNILGYKEIDIYLPEFKFGVEYHGNYWHTETVVGRKYHLTKANLAIKNGVRLIQIFEHEWRDKQDIIKSRILSLLSKNQKIFARKTVIKVLSKEEKSKFLTENHIQGNDNSSIFLGLEYENEIIACMTFGKPRFNDNYNWELIRYCSLKNVNIIGGAGKLLKYFRRNRPGSIISYADRRFSCGKLYHKLGFKLDDQVDPGYFYYNIKNKDVHNRMKFQKHLLKGMPFYSEELTEYEIMKLNGFDRIWDAGQYRFTLE